MSEVDHGHDLGVDWVDVSAEPHHVEQFCIHGLRVFEVTIEPGTSTQFHRHHRDTIYVRTTTGRSRAEEPGHQPTKASLGRSTGLTTRLRLLASRKLSQGWLEIPAGTVILQPHHSLPLIHRVTAHQSNPRALRMIGVELQRDYRKPQPFPETRQLLAECPAREWWPVYRLRVSPHGHATLSLPGGGALIVVCGTALLVGAQDSVIESSQAHWLAPGIATVHASGPQALDAVLVPT